MASSRALTKISCDWSKILAKVNEAEVKKINRLKSIMDSNAIKVSTLPESLPKIDWAHYKANAVDPKLVEELEKSYNQIKIEPPKAPAARLQEIDEAERQIEARYQKFSARAQSYVESIGVVKKKFEDMIPVKDMLMEDWCLTFPYWSKSIENPSTGPHYGRAAGLTLEEQIAFEQPDPLPYSTKTAWKDWEERKKKFYS